MIPDYVEQASDFAQCVPDAERRRQITLDTIQLLAWGMPFTATERLILLYCSTFCTCDWCRVKLADLAEYCSADVLATSRAVSRLEGLAILYLSPLGGVIGEGEMWIRVSKGALVEAKAEWHAGRAEP